MMELARPSTLLNLLATAMLVTGCSVGTPGPGISPAPAVSASTIPPPPPPTVTVSKGRGVYSTTDPPGVCTSASCAYVVVATANFAGSVTCRPSGWGLSWSQGANETTQSPNYFGYPDATVTVTCSGAGETATGSLTW